MVANIVEKVSVPNSDGVFANLSRLSCADLHSMTTSHSNFAKPLKPRKLLSLDPRDLAVFPDRHGLWFPTEHEQDLAFPDLEVYLLYQRFGRRVAEDLRRSTTPFAPPIHNEFQLGRT